MAGSAPLLDEILSPLTPKDKSSSLKKDAKQFLRSIKIDQPQLLKFQNSPEYHV
jgi:hypothetical protein